MLRELTLTHDPINESALLAQRQIRSESGAAVYFSGVVRGSEKNDPIAAIEYESFELMARHQFDLLLSVVEQMWPIQSVRLTHRLGRVGTGETAVWLEVISPHRHEAFAACQFIIDEMKRHVPIWKKILHD